MAVGFHTYKPHLSPVRPHVLPRLSPPSQNTPRTHVVSGPARVTNGSPLSEPLLVGGVGVGPPTDSAHCQGNKGVINVIQSLPCYITRSRSIEAWFGKGSS